METLKEYVVVTFFGLLITLITMALFMAFANEERRLDERLLLEKHYQEVTIPMMLKEKVPFIPRLKLEK